MTSDEVMLQKRGRNLMTGISKNADVDLSYAPIINWGEIPKRGFVWAFQIYVFLLILLPSGGLFGINIKFVLFVVLLVLTLCELLSRPNALVQVCTALAIPLIFLSWIFVGQFYLVNITDSLTQFKDIASTFGGCWFVSVFIAPGQQRRFQFVKLAIYSVSFVALAKLAIIVFAFFSNVSVVEIMGALGRLFNVQLMTLDIENSADRMQMLSDVLAPVCAFALFCFRREMRIKQSFAVILLALLVCSIALTFSRYIWFYGAVAAVLGFFVSKKDKVHLWFSVIVLSGILYAFQSVSALFALRFSEELAGSSDLERVLQRAALTSFFFEAPVFGHGFGSHALQVIRDPKLPYSYELQSLALVGQIGIIGVMLLLALLCYYFRGCFSFHKKNRPYELGVLVLLVLWLSAGFFNPFLISSTAAMSYGMLLALAKSRMDSALS